MDVHCSSCGEPWDAYHLRHDAIFETNLDPAEAETWRGLSPAERLSSCYRDKLKAAGYEFGASVYDVLHCPCCPKGAKPDPETVALKADVTAMLGDDEDGIASAFEEIGL